MKITVTTLWDYVFSLDVAEDLELENFKAFCEVESGIPSTDIEVTFSGQPLEDDKKSLKDYGIKEGDIVVLQQKLQNQQPLEQMSTPQTFSNVNVPAAPANTVVPRDDSMQVSNDGQTLSIGPDSDPANVRDFFLENPHMLSIMEQNNPRLAEAFRSGSLETFSSVLRQQIEARTKKQLQKVRMLQNDPFSTETQKMIAEEIRQKNIEANMEAAMEYSPETFGSVVMLYINCKVNGVPVKAFIDSGAQTTVMSAACAERCNINRLIDARWAGIAKGVGVQRIIGRIHMVEMQIEQDFLPTSFSVLQEKRMDMLLGLDMLKRHQCNIDLKNNVLVIGTTGTETPFLPENDLPESARLTGSPKEELDDSIQEVEDIELKEALERSRSDQPASTSGNTSTSETYLANTAVAPSTILPTDKFTENDVAEIVSMGCSREQAIEVLRKNNGDKATAIAVLIARSLDF